MSRMQKHVNQKVNQWNREALIALARHGKAGGEFTTKVWANGQTMVTPKTEWATSLHAVPREIALKIFKNNWVIPAEVYPKRPSWYSEEEI